MKFTKPLLNSSRSHTSFVCENLNHAAKTAVEKNGTLGNAKNSFFTFWFVFCYHFFWVQFCKNRLHGIILLCFGLSWWSTFHMLLIVFLTGWLHCFVAAFVDDYLKQVISIFGTFPSIFNIGFSHVFVFVFVTAIFFEINFVSWHFCLVSFGNFVASFFLFQYWFWVQISSWSLWRLV